MKSCFLGLLSRVNNTSLTKHRLAIGLGLAHRTRRRIPLAQRYDWRLPFLARSGAQSWSRGSSYWPIPPPHRLPSLESRSLRSRLALRLKLPLPRNRLRSILGLLASYAGIYVMAPQFSLTVTFEAGKLMVQATGQQKIRVFAESETKFYYKVVDAQIRFVPAEDGRVNKLVLHQGGRDMEAIRKD